MQTIRAVDPVRFQRMTTAEMRESFLVDSLFQPGKIELVYWEIDRTIAGGAMPLGSELKLEAGKELAAQYFCERRELGILNLGGAGKVTVDGQVFELAKCDCLYVGRGCQDIRFASQDAAAPAAFYLLSYPAHAPYPTRLVRRDEANIVNAGSKAECNERTIRQYIRPGVAASCQLVMGYTELAEGSVWNTMKPHTHERRSEVYLYFDVQPGQVVFHLMGAAAETRHLVVQDKQLCLSPIWSIHSGAGTRRYCFVWGMGGENQEFTDMDHVEIPTLK
jgi:4-deoxy-L-threo-5-hexosulose-uronate ketol-isomerase